MKVLNITSGEDLNSILSASEENCVPFNEAMIKGTYDAALFSDEFIKQRSATHGVTCEAYLEKFKAYLDAVNKINEYDKIVLWFGDEDFCRANREVCIKHLKMSGCKAPVFLNIVKEPTSEVESVIKIDMN